MVHLAGCVTVARTRGEDLATWETLFTPREEYRHYGEPVDQISDGRTDADARVVRQRRSIRQRGRLKARGTGAETEGGQGVGGLHRSEEAG